MFRTEINIPESKSKIGLGDRILTIGSCFSDTIGQRLADHKFFISSNPLGTVYNPLSIFKLIENSILENEVTENELINNQGIFYHYDYHSDLSSDSPEELISLINEKQKEVHDFLAKSNWLIITFGTSFIYELRSNGTVVSNCHKVPAAEFEKKQLSTKSILSAFDKTHSLLKKFNPEIKNLITVSPVRHVKDTLELNQVSKSTLRLASHFIRESYSDVQYFPGYEIMLDDLRDYRYYHKDMIHPSDLAVDYIWDKFQEIFFDEETRFIVKKWNKIRQGLEHRPFHPQSEKHQQFLKNILTQLNDISSEIEVSSEIKWVKSQII